jgi:hypothetical protein
MSGALLRSAGRIICGVWLLAVTLLAAVAWSRDVLYVFIAWLVAGFRTDRSVRSDGRRN